uniref:Uncharacterized protein n=1 Tax=Tanacetum cinerariifolium TaxID=118510 RepID=A0A6L2LSZ2_TANCI|nr:hypothetical protein [Tanacetum cinerariifolium]
MTGMMMKESEERFLSYKNNFHKTSKTFLMNTYYNGTTNLLFKKKIQNGIKNPFTAKRGEDHTVVHLSKNEEKDDDLPYPKFRKFKQLAAQIINKHEEHAFLTDTAAESSTSYQPPPDAIIGPTVYPPARQNPQPTYKPDYQFGYPIGRCNAFNGGYGEYHNSQWTLPPSWMESGVMLVVPIDIGLWSDNLFGERKKLMWHQWRIAYPSAYSALETITNDPQNITSKVRQLIIMEDPYRGSNDEQDRAYMDLDRITWEETKNLWSFLEDLRQLAIKLGKLYFPSTTEKLFAKLPPSLSKKIEESFKARHPDAALAKELKDLSLCSAISIPGYYKNNKKKYGIRQSRTYNGKPNNSHEGHFAKDCRSKQGNIARSTVYQELDLDDNWDIVSADFDDSSVYSISEGEGDVHQNISIMVQDTLFEEAAFMTIDGINENDDEQSVEEDYADQNSHHAFMFHPGPPKK